MKLHPYLLLLGLAWNPLVHAAPPPAPEGFAWVRNPTLSDEFNGHSLDLSKWHDHHPTWRGRAPAKFVPSAISVKDGFLQLRNSMLPEPDGAFTIGSGAVISKEPSAFYGYYEARMKASKSVMSSTFWFSNRGKKVNGASVSHELDVVEAVGITDTVKGTGNDWGDYMHSNTHIKASGAAKSITTPEKVRVEPPVAEAFHTYGVWWVDANTVKIYLDEKLVYTMHPSTKYSDKPFDLPMQMNIVTETYGWQKPPTPESLKEAAANTTQYDWVRSYTLEPKAAPAASGRKKKETP